MDERSADARQQADDEGVVHRVMTSTSFVEKAALLLMTVLLSGLLAPLAITYLKTQEAERTRVLELTRLRNETILAAQSELLKEFTETLLTYETLALDVSWFGTPKVADRDMQQKAYRTYSERIAELLTRWRMQISQARILADNTIADDMVTFLDEVMFLQDEPITRLFKAEGEAGASDWQQQHQQNVDMLDRANDLLSRLAMGLRISRADLGR